MFLKYQISETLMHEKPPMPTQQDYKTARILAQERLAQNDLAACCNRAGVSFTKDPRGTGRISIPFLGNPYELIVEDGIVSFDESVRAVRLQDQVLLLHYLMTASGSSLQDQWITFREVPSGPFYYPSFVKRAIVPLVSCFGDHPEGLEKVGRKMGKLVSEPGDIGVVVLALPRVPVVLCLWKGDDEFAPEGNVFFDASITSYLDTEDIAYLAGSVVYRAIGMFRSAVAS
jgi:hypothetical protein